MSGVHNEESVGEPEEIRMGRLHSLLTRNKDPSSVPSSPPKNKTQRSTQVVLKGSQRMDGQMRARIHLDPTPPHTPSRMDRALKPSSSLTRAKWRAVSMLQHYQKGMEIRSHQQSAEADIFPFLALPPELRMAVFFELLVTDDRVLPTWRGPRKATKQQKKMYINILLACKLCRDEGLQVLYGENIFDFGEICNRPNNFSKPFVNHIGRHNASLIRIVFAEYSAASEELALSDTAPISKPLHDPKPKIVLSVAHLRSFLATFNISLPSLRLLAISIMPYGNDQATDYLLQLANPDVRRNMHLRVKWLDAKNDKVRLGELVDGICEREKGLLKAEYWRDVDGWIGFNFAPPSSGREWVVYQGVRGKEEGMAEKKEDGEAGMGEGCSVEALGAAKSALVLYRT